MSWFFESPWRFPEHPSFGLLMLLMVLTAEGCGLASASDSGDSPPSHATPSPQLGTNDWDAGIVFPGSDTNVAFPLVDERLQNAAQVAEIHTSCECTSAEAVDYVDSRGEKKIAIRIRIAEPVDDTENFPPDHAGSALLIQFDIVLKGGESIQRRMSMTLSGTPDKN